MPNWKTTVKKMVRNGALGPCDFGLACYKETSFSSHWEEIILMSLKWVKTYSKGVVPIYCSSQSTAAPCQEPSQMHGVASHSGPLPSPSPSRCCVPLGD